MTTAHRIAVLRPLQSRSITFPLLPASSLVHLPLGLLLALLTTHGQKHLGTSHMRQQSQMRTAMTLMTRINLVDFHADVVPPQADVRLMVQPPNDAQAQAKSPSHSPRDLINLCHPNRAQQQPPLTHSAVSPSLNLSSLTARALDQL